MRKIVHIDMDAFYASVEQRDDPALRGRPVVVAWRGARSVVCAASYEARRFGIRSAMPAIRAARLCPDAVFVPPDFARYRAVSNAVRAIFLRHTLLVEPLSLDEAYLDVTEPLSSLPSATAIAEDIRRAIRDELQLTASAGIAPNKFLAKLASDWNKPDGQLVIRPHQVADFLLPLPVAKLPGVGKVTHEKLRLLGAETVAELQTLTSEMLEQSLGRFGQRLYRLARGIDESPVRAEQPTQSISAEDTLAHDQPLQALADQIAPLAEKVWRGQAKTARIGRTVVLKLKTADFRILTRSVTPTQPPASCETLIALCHQLLQRVDAAPDQLYRLIGVGLSNFYDPEEQPTQSALF